MKLLKIAFILIFCIISANASNLHRSERVRRSNDESLVDKVRTGFKNFATGVKSYTSKGIEEVKNLFSRDRNVGDYRLNQIDVRFGDDESTTTTVEEKTEIIVREKREIEQDMVEIAEHAGDQNESHTEGERVILTY